MSDVGKHEDFWAQTHFKWPAPLPGDVHISAFEAQHSIFDFDWNLVIFWDRGIADAIRTLDYNKHYPPMENFALDEIVQRLRDEPDGGIEMWKQIAARVPLTEVRCVDHLEVAIRHLVKANKDVAGKPFVVYDAVTGTWKSEGETLRYGAAKTVGSLVDQIVGRLFAEAMNQAVDFLEELALVVITLPPDPYLGLDAAAKKALQQAPTPAVNAFENAKRQRKILLDRIKPAKEMQQSITRGKYAPIKNLLRGRLCVGMTEWDSNTEWLILRDGAINVREVYQTGQIKLYPHSPEHMSTMALEAGWSDAVRNAGTSEWDAGVEKVLPDVEVRTYLQKRFGGALLGTPGLAGKSMVWQYGVGDTAKSTIQECIAGARGVFAPYSVVSSADALTEQGAARGAGERFKAYARGKRFAIMSELPDQEMLDQGILKSVTGGETVEGTAKYQNAVSYFFTATVFMASNHAPRLPNGDTAAMNRVHVVPFDHRLWVQSKNPKEWSEATPDHRADEQWADRVLSSPHERAAILRWVLDGLVTFGRDGGIGELPAAMMHAREDFMSEADPVGKIVRALLGTEPTCEKPALIKIYTDREWAGSGRLERDGMTTARLEELINFRARELALTKFGEEGVSTRWLRSGCRMVHELGGNKKMVLLDPNTRKTGRVYSRVSETEIALGIHNGQQQYSI